MPDSISQTPAPARMLSRIRGGLYGQALGDAWAMPVYFNMEMTEAAYGQWITEFLPAPADHLVHHGMPAGRFTDDTEQAFAMADEIIRDGEMTLDGAVRAILGWYSRIDGDNSPYVGPSTRRGVEFLKRGADPYAAGARGDTNGCAMRVSVVGLVNAGDPAGAIREAMISAMPTHSTDAAYSGAAAVAAAVAQACVTDSVDEVITAGIAGAIEGRKHGHPWLAASLPRRIEMAVAMARAKSTPRARMHEIYDVIGTGLLVTESVPAAFAVLAMADGDPVQAAIYAAALSGDADTIGAIACAMAGALRGIEAIPVAHQETLRAANPGYDFEATARGLWAIQQQRETAR